MKNFLILTLSIFLLSCSNFDKRYHIDDVCYLGGEISYLKVDMSPLNGTVYSDVGELGKFINGVRDGLWREWYHFFNPKFNGQLEYEGNYVHGKEEGLHRAWYTNGQLRREKQYKNGITDGFLRWYYDNGQLEYEGNYVHGKEEGYHMQWYDDGQLWRKNCYENGLEVSSLFFDQNR